VAWTLGNAAPASALGSSVTNTQKAFASSVTSGDVIVAASLWFTSGGTSQTASFTDVSSNVTTWNTSNFFDAAIPFGLAISWGLATSTGTCTPKVTWTATATVLELYVGDFTPPGTASADGAIAGASFAGSSTTITTPAGNGTQSSDLVINIVGADQTFGSFSSPWTAMGPSQGDGAAYVLNASGSSTPNASQAPAGRYGSAVLAIQSTGGGVTLIPDLIMAPAHR
jgi:hypothetical protein